MDITALQGELTSLALRWEELDSQLTAKLREFQRWMQTNFPKPAAAGFYDPHLPFRLYPAAQADCAGAYLEMDSPHDAEAFIFMVRDRDGDSYAVRLPFAWIQDPDTFKQTVQVQVDAEQARLDARKPKRDEVLRKLSAARAEVYRLEREISNA